MSYVWSRSFVAIVDHQPLPQNSLRSGQIKGSSCISHSDVESAGTATSRRQHLQVRREVRQEEVRCLRPTPAVDSRPRCRMAQGRSVNKKKSVFSSNAVCSPEPWRFERRVSISPRLRARMRVEALRFRAMRVASIIAAGPCIEKDHSSTWRSSSFAGAVETAPSRWST